VLCARKQVVRAGAEVDHVVPLFKGGADDESNRQTLCSECHKAKTRQDLGHRNRIEFDANGNPLWPTTHWGG
jgi:5-methylcytosine-specific restriction protein A